MISLSFINPKKKEITIDALPVIGKTLDHNYQVMVEARAKKFNITPQEWLRRDAIIRRVSSECPLVFGDIAFPTTKKDMEKYGRCLVTSKVKSYIEMDADQWHENPFIITARSFVPGQEESLFVCTHNFLTKKEPLNDC